MRQWGTAVALCCLLLAPLSAVAQVTPSDNESVLDGRGCTATSKCWCPLIPRSFFLNPTNVSDLLQGHIVHVAAFHEPPWSIVNNSAPDGVGWGKKFSGFEVSLLAEIATLGGFQLQFTEGPKLANQSWTEALLQQKDLVDLIAGGMMDTSERRGRGVTFTTPYSDFGVSLIVKKPRVESPGFWENAFFWLRPFTPDAYIAILAVWLVPGVCVWLLEKERQVGLAGFTETLFMGWLAIIGFGDFAWIKNWFSRAVHVCWSFVILVLLASYTASMTNFLVQSSKSQLTVTGTEDLLQKGGSLCLPAGWGMTPLAKDKWSARARQLIEVDADELSAWVNDLRCEGLLLPRDYGKVLLAGGPPRTLTAGPPHACSMQFLGASDIQAVGGLVAGTANCRWFVVQVVGSLIRKVAEQHMIARLFEEAVLAATTTPDGSPQCPAETATADADETVRITLQHLAGLMLIGFSPIILVSVAGIITNAVCKARGDRFWAVDRRTLDDESIGLLNAIRKRQSDMMDEVAYIANHVRRTLGDSPNGVATTASSGDRSLHRDRAFSTMHDRRSRWDKDGGTRATRPPPLCGGGAFLCGDEEEEDGGAVGDDCCDELDTLDYRKSPPPAVVGKQQEQRMRGKKVVTLDVSPQYSSEPFPPAQRVVRPAERCVVEDGAMTEGSNPSWLTASDDTEFEA